MEPEELTQPDQTQIVTGNQAPEPPIDANEAAAVAATAVDHDKVQLLDFIQRKIRSRAAAGQRKLKNPCLGYAIKVSGETVQSVYSLLEQQKYIVVTINGVVEISW